MSKKIIRLCYRKLIDASSEKTWDRHVFESTWTEFRMQAQFYDRDKKYTSFGQLLQQVPAAEKLHFLVSAAVTGYLQQLNGIVPDILNNQGLYFIPFTEYRFEIVNSDVHDKKVHQVAINFFSDRLQWHATIDNYLLVSATQENNNDEVLTEMVQLQPFLSIYSLQTIDE